MNAPTTRTTRATAAASKTNPTASAVIKAYLRIRPAPHVVAVPYLDIRDERTVTMTPPNVLSKNNIRSNKRPAQTFSFDRIFGPSTLQDDLFKQTAFPLIKSALLDDNSGLLFTYGVSNSGKTYSLQGEKQPATQGIIPRTIETVFASIKGKQVEGSIGNFHDVYIPGQKQSFPFGTEACSVQVQDGDQFAVWASFVEIYNEKVFDLLNEVAPSASGAIKRQGLTLKAGQIPDLKWFRVRTREEALAVFQAGQVNRQIFGTAQNRMSSRSHGIFELRIAKIKRDGSRLKKDATKICKLSMVDLAGSERTKNTQSTGERLREASHINTGLMTLGRCFEIMRSNQDNWKKKMHVPYKHSKLTEMFQSFFNGQGSAVMLVCVNPFDSTCFDENLHVMRFSAVAREVQTSNKHATAATKIRLQAPGSSKEEEFELIEAEAESDEEADALVTYLWDEVRSLRLQLLETQLQNATIEAEVREEVVRETEEHLAEMKASYDRRLQMEIEAHERKTDLKLDMMQRDDSDSD